jgi:hypothetical protein
MFLHCINTGFVHEQSKIKFQVLQGHHLLGQGRNLEELLPLFFVA